MPLPKIDLPRYSHHLKGLNKKIKFRGFTTKEQKILLQAKEDGTDEQMFEAIEQVIELCTFGELDVKNTPFFDIEDLLIRIRAKSVSEVVEMKYRVHDKDNKPTGEVIDVTINLNDVEVTYPEGHDNKIMVTDDIGFVLKYPSITGLDETDSFTTLKNSIDFVFDKDEVYYRDSFTEDELEDFIDNFDIGVWKKIETFFKTVPRVRYTTEVELKDGSKEEIKLEGVKDFF